MPVCDPHRCGGLTVHLPSDKQLEPVESNVPVLCHRDGIVDYQNLERTNLELECPNQSLALVKYARLVLECATLCPLWQTAMHPWMPSLEGQTASTEEGL